MYVQQVALVVHEGREAEFEAALCEVRQRVFMCRGFRGFTVAQGVEDPGSYVVRVRWETLDELAQAGEAGLLDRSWEPVQPFLERPLRAEHLTERPSLGDQGPGVITDLSWMTA